MMAKKKMPDELREWFVAQGARGGRKAKRMTTKEQRSEWASKASRARWNKKKKAEA